MSQKEVPYQIGDLVTYKTHPFFIENVDIYIQSRAEYTPPILNIFEILNPIAFNDGKEEKDIQYQCIYYSTKSGVFEKKWFKHNELKLIKKQNNVELSETRLKEYIGKNVILKSVDLELNKKKSHLVIDKNSLQKKSHHLDFLPPLLQVIGIIENDEIINSKKTVNTVKHKYSLKVKWFNYIKDKFSEDILPISVLKEVKIYESLIKKIKVKNYYKFGTLKIGNNKKIDNIIEIIGIYYNTYTYIIEIKNCLTNKLYRVNIEWFKSFKEYNNIFSEEILGITEKGYKKLDPSIFKKNNLYKINYRDNLGKITDLYVVKINGTPLSKN